MIKRLDELLSLVLTDFDKEARRYRFTREGVITETIFPASDPPNRYPTFLASDCNWHDGDVKSVYQVSNGLMIHKHVGISKPFYPCLEIPPMNNFHLGQKPRGMYMALGAMWFEFENDAMMSHISKVSRFPGDENLLMLSEDSCAEEENISFTHSISKSDATTTTGISLEIERVSTTSSRSETEDISSTHSISETGGDSATDNDNDTEMEFEPALRLLAIITISVSPDVFTWEVSATAATNKHKILVVDCKQQWDKVEAAFGVAGSPYQHPLDWDKLAKTYAGIDVRIGESNKMSDGPIWVIGWDCIGPCIWDLAAVEAELQVRTAGSFLSALTWIKAQEAKATSLKVLLGSGAKQGDEEEERAAFTMSCLYMEKLRDTWRSIANKEYEDEGSNEVVGEETEDDGNHNEDVDEDEDEHKHNAGTESDDEGAKDSEGYNSGYERADDYTATDDGKYVKGGESYSVTDHVAAYVRTLAPAKMQRNQAMFERLEAAYEAQVDSAPQDGPDGDDA